MRATDLHRVAHDLRHSRGSDWLAMVVMLAAFICGLAVFEAVAITLLDWIEGRPHSVLPALMALFETLDGGAR